MTKLNFEVEDALGIITLVDKPLNLIDVTFIEELGAILDGDRIKEVRALLFKVDKGNFSAGANIAVFIRIPQD
ncbi:MAG: hypothetical protein P8Y23_11765 [Candidatus Lokiarchaeota archaeon]|jgi:enoyl-CoA hydratase/carnithine racemase